MKQNRRIPKPDVAPQKDKDWPVPLFWLTVIGLWAFAGFQVWRVMK